MTERLTRKEQAALEELIAWYSPQRSTDPDLRSRERIGQRLGISREMVRVIELQAMRKLRKRISTDWSPRV